MNELRIITYHYVRDVENSEFPGIHAISIEEFRKQIEWISETGKVITQNDLLAAYDRKSELPDNAFLLTFDDGYKDHIENVMPVLEEYGMTGVFFLPVKGIIERNILPANKIQHILANNVDSKEVTSKIFKSLVKYRDEYDLKSDDDYWEECAKEGRFDGPEVKFIKNMLQTFLPKKVRSSILDGLFHEYVTADQKGFAEKLYLNLDDAKAMKEKGMDIQSHGYEHERLEFMTKEEQTEDTKKAVLGFEALGIDKSNWTACYPYGSYNKDTEEVLRSFGCKAGYSTKGGVTNIEEVGRFEINRMDATELVGEMEMTRLLP